MTPILQASRPSIRPLRRVMLGPRGPAYCCAPPHSGQNLAILGMDLPQLMQNLLAPAEFAGAGEPGCETGSAAGGAGGRMAFIICCPIITPAPKPTPVPAAPPSLAAAMGNDCATLNCV